MHMVPVRELLAPLSEPPLGQIQIAHLLSSLHMDGLIEYLSWTQDEDYAEHIHLTSAGRAEVERWIMTDQPTPHLPVIHSQINNIIVLTGEASDNTFNQGTGGT